MLDLNLHNDHDQDQDQDLFSSKLQSFFLMTPSHHHQPLAAGLRGSCDFLVESHKQEAYKFESDCETLIDNKPLESGNKGVKLKIRRREENNISSSEKWLSSKMRMMKKMLGSDDGSTVLDQKIHGPSSHVDPETDNSSCNNSSIRVCVDCNTTKTPLWRSGPTGPKSLCNACGIRQRKARRAMATAANGTTPPLIKKLNKRPLNNNNPKLKKRCKMVHNSPSNYAIKSISFEDLRMRLISNSGFEQVFPPDEKEAAILLMALSYGLVH